MVLSAFFSTKSMAMANGVNKSQKVLTAEICDNRIDDDGDGLIDCMDPDCSGDVSCWECDEDFYQVHSNNTIVRLNANTGSYETVGSVSGASAINGAAMSHIDGHVYAPCIIDGVHTLGMLMNDGSVVDLELSFPGNIFYVGGISTDGKLYVNAGSSPIYMIDLTQETLTYVATGTSNPGVADFAVDNTTGLFYGISGGHKLKVYDPFADAMSTYDLAGSINNESGGYGAAWSSVDGSFFAYNNSSGKIFSIDIVTLTATEVLNGVGNLSINDGFNCLSAPPPFETFCNNGIDDDGDGVIDCDDGDCFSSNECTYEICDNGIDDDNDGWVDCSDTECFNLTYCIEICDNGIDDNGNGLVDGDDPQCSTPPGVVGGLESNGSLADKIAKRNIKQVIERDEIVEMKKEGIIPFVPSAVRGAYDLSEFIPVQVKDAYVSESTPEDLIGITNAEDVVAADYYIDNQRVGSILAIESYGVYEHTKYICDRLEGSRLLDMSHLYSNGGLFMSYELFNSQFDVEYAVSFSMYHDESKGFIIENHWNLNSYPQDKEYYNFQIWASDYDQLLDLLDATLNKVIQKDVIYTINNSELPRLFITQGEYNNGNLELLVRNKDGVNNCQYAASIRRTETSNWEEIVIDVPLQGLQSEYVDIPVGYLYDMGGSLRSDSSTSDEIFLADGRWTVSDDHAGATLINHQIGEQITEDTEDSYQVERSISLQAEVTNYLNIYRSLDPKFKPVNLDQYNTISFDAKGEGQMEVTLVKASVDNCDLQPRAKMSLKEDGATYNLQSSSFAGTADWTDVVMVVFTLVNSTGTSTLYDITLSDVTFDSMILTSTIDSEDTLTESFISPNPVSNAAIISYDTPYQGSGMLSIINALGIEVMTRQLNIKHGHESISIETDALMTGYYYYSITLEGSLLTSGSFTKVD